MDAAPSVALAGLLQLARLSRLTLLYHGPDVWTDDAGRERAAAIAAAAASCDDVVVLFDAGSDMPVPDLLSGIEAAVLKAAPDAPLAPPMAGPVEALAFWQEALGLRFLMIFHRFEAALATPDPEFDQVLLRLVRDPLEVSLLLMMDESAAPLLQRLRAALPDLGEAYLRMPDPAAAAAPAPPSVAPAPSPQIASPYAAALPDEEMRDAAPVAQPQPQPQPQPRRSRDFSSLLEQASTVPDPGDSLMDVPALQVAPPAPAVTQVPDDDRQEPWPASPAPAGPGPGREPFALQVPAWMHQRQGRRRRASMALATTVGSRSTILLLFLLLLAVLTWPMPPSVATPAAVAAADSRAAAPVARHRVFQADATRGNR